MKRSIASHPSCVTNYQNPRGQPSIYSAKLSPRPRINVMTLANKQLAIFGTRQHFLYVPTAWYITSALPDMRPSRCWNLYRPQGQQASPKKPSNNCFSGLTLKLYSQSIAQSSWHLTLRMSTSPPPALGTLFVTSKLARINTMAISQPAYQQSSSCWLYRH